MAWNDFSYTKKGGIIGMGLGILLFLFIMLLPVLLKSVIYNVFYNSIENFLFYLPTLIWDSFGADNYGFLIFTPLFFLIQCLIIGSLIGFIVGKFKGENKQ